MKSFKLSFGVLAAIIASVSGVALAQVSDNPATAASTSTPLTPEEDNAKAANDRGLAANNAGDLATALAAWQEAYNSAPDTANGKIIAMEAAKRLGYVMIEHQDPRRAEAYFAAEAVIGRKLFFQGELSARKVADAVNHWASAAGAMGRSNESAALVFYAREIRARAAAASSSQILNREAEFKADSIEGMHVNIGTFCATSYVEILAKHVTCEDEAGARTEAVTLESRQIKADAPPPMTKAERDAKAKDKGGDDE